MGGGGDPGRVDRLADGRGTRRTWHACKKKEEKLHLLKGLKRILLDIDKAIAIIRETEEDAEVVPNLMIGFGIDQVQAEYVADIKLRNINKEYILKRIDEVDALEAEIADLKDIINSPARIKDIIISELENVKKRYSVPRRTEIVYEHQLEAGERPGGGGPGLSGARVHLPGGVPEKDHPQSLRMSSEQKYKEGDGPFLQWEGTNGTSCWCSPTASSCYKTRLSDFDDSKASVLGDYLPPSWAWTRRKNSSGLRPRGLLRPPAVLL